MESEPVQSTEDIAASVIETSEREEAIESAPSESAAAPEPATEVVAPEPVKLSPAAEFLLKQGHKAKKEDGRDNWLPVKTTEGMLERYYEQRAAAFMAERTKIEEERNRYKADLDEFHTDFRGDERAFLEKLAQHDPRYKSFLTPAEKVQIAENADDPEPQLVLDKGAEAYTASLKEVRAWDRRQAKREALAETKAMVEPYKERLQREEADRSGREAYQKAMTEAATWPMWGTEPPTEMNEFRTEVLKVLQADTSKRMSFRQAYLEVESKHKEKLLAEDDATRRAKWQAELNAAPKSTSVVRAGTENTRVKPRTTEDIAREIIGKG
jgi:hypothetical protein